MTFEAANVASFGAVGDGIADDLPAFQAAIASLGPGGGVVSGPARKYRLAGTLGIDRQIALDFRCNGNGGDQVGAILYGTADAPILRYLPGTRFARVTGLSVVGDGVGPSQHGIVVANGGIWAENITIRGCGGDGLHVEHSFAGSFRNLYISHCAGHGARLAGQVGANLWQQLVVADNGGDGLCIDSIAGSDVFMGLVTEQNEGFGTRIDGGTRGCQAWGVFSEYNGSGPISFGALTSENAWHFSSCGCGEPMVAACYRGGTRNAWDGSRHGCPIRHMFPGSVGVGLDTPAAALDVAGSMALSGWRVMSFNDTTLRVGSDTSPGWSGVDIWTSGTRRQWW